MGYPLVKIRSGQTLHCQPSRHKVASQRNSAEAECLANADVVTHIEQVPSLLHLVFVQRGLDIDEGTQWVREKLERSWNKLSSPVQALMRERYEALLQVLAAKPVIEAD